MTASPARIFVMKNNNEIDQPPPSKFRQVAKPVKFAEGQKIFDKLIAGLEAFKNEPGSTFTYETGNWKQVIDQDRKIIVRKIKFSLTRPSTQTIKSILHVKKQASAWVASDGTITLKLEANRNQNHPKFYPPMPINGQFGDPGFIEKALKAIHKKGEQQGHLQSSAKGLLDRLREEEPRKKYFFPVTSVPQ